MHRNTDKTGTKKVSRVSELVVIDGISKTRLQWCETIGITSSLLTQRMRRDGVTLAEAIQKGGRKIGRKAAAKERRRAALAAIPLPQEPLRMLPSAPSYYITPDGRVWSEKTKQWLRVTPHVSNPDNPDRAYGRVRLGDQARYAHNLVAEAWIENPEKHTQVLFVDDNSLNYHKDNLVWACNREAFLYRRRLRKCGEQEEGAV